MLSKYKEIGHQKVGVFGIAKEVQHIETGQVKYLKSIKKNKHDPKQLDLKRASLKRLLTISSNLILVPEAVDEDDEHLHVVTDLAKGEELQRLVIVSKRLDERTSILILRSLIHVLKEYMRFGLMFALFQKRPSMRENLR